MTADIIAFTPRRCILSGCTRPRMPASEGDLCAEHEEVLNREGRVIADGVVPK